MMKKIFKLVLFTAFISINIFAQRSPSGEKGFFYPDSDLQKELDQAGQQFVDVGYISGGVSMIAHKGKIIYQKAFGMQSIEEEQAMQMNSLFRIASMTKPITTVALLLLVEEGKISLDDKAEKYLPQFASIKVLAPDGSLQAPKRKVTIRQLLMHTSGTRSRGDSWFRNNKISFSSATSLEEYVNLLLKGPLVFHPNEGFNYAMNNDICARIVEIITRQNFGDYLRQRVLQPLEMDNTWFVVPKEELHRLSSIYRSKDAKLSLVEGKEAIQSKFPRGNGQMVSTAGDYMNFLQMLLDGGMYKGKRLIKEETLKLMTMDKLPKDIPLKVGRTVFPNTGFGLSVAISRRKTKVWEPLEVRFDNLFQHLPEGSFLWPGITNTFFWVDPKNEITGIVLSQSVNPGEQGNFQVFTQTFYEHFFKEPKIKKSKNFNKKTSTGAVWNKELEFSKACAEIGIYQATTKYISDEGILFKPGPVNGKKYQSQNHPAPIFIKTYPESVEASLAGDMGFVTGYWEQSSSKPNSSPASFGMFSTVWRKQSNGDWKVVIANAIGGINPQEFQKYQMGHKWEEIECRNGKNEESVLKTDSKLNEAIASKNSSLSHYYEAKHQVLQNHKIPTDISLISLQGSKWNSMRGITSEMHDMAYTYGSFTDSTTKKEQYYLRFWKKNSHNQWRVFMDLYKKN